MTKRVDPFVALIIGALSVTSSSAIANPIVSESTANTSEGPRAVNPTCGPSEGVSIHDITIGDGDGLWRVLKRAGIAQDEIGGVLTALKKLTSLDIIPPGRTLELKQDDSGRLVSFEQRPTPAVSHCIELAASAGNNVKYSARTFELPIETRIELVSGRVKKSVRETIEELGEQPALAYLLRELFTKNGRDPFAREVAGIRFRVLVEKTVARDELVGYGQVLAAELVLADGEVRRAFYYESKQGEAGHYSQDGLLLKRSTFALPVIGAQITSNYGVREHPITGGSQAHLGIDFAAPEGTLVRAARDGVVELTPSHRDLGNYVSIEHEGQLVTRYGHLRAFAQGLTSGKWVKKGTVIGYVGCTGFSTGPHLHFETIAGGMHLNPNRFFGGHGAKLDETELSLFHIATAQLVAMFDVADGDARDAASTVAFGPY